VSIKLEKRKRRSEEGGQVALISAPERTLRLRAKKTNKRKELGSREEKDMAFLGGQIKTKQSRFSLPQARTGQKQYQISGDQE